MQVDGNLGGWQTAAVIGEARRHEQAGYDGLWSSESAHDPFLPLVLAAEHTERIELGTAIAVAFARSPMQLAYTAHDLQSLSGGRFTLGLGSQIRPHIERRFGMPWSHPAPRMREYILALRAIWSAWNEGAALSFRGDFYRHTLMTPFFSPPPAPGGAPRVFLAAVGEAMTAVAGEVADGLLVHPFTTERYLREVTLPALGRGLARSGRSRDASQVSLLLMIATGRTEEELARAVAGHPPADRVLRQHPGLPGRPRAARLGRARRRAERAVPVLAGGQVGGHGQPHRRRRAERLRRRGRAARGRRRRSAAGFARPGRPGVLLRALRHRRRGLGPHPARSQGRPRFLSPATPLPFSYLTHGTED